MYIYIYIYIYIYVYITVPLQQSAQWEEQIIGIKNDSLFLYTYIYIYIYIYTLYILHTRSGNTSLIKEFT